MKFFRSLTFLVALFSQAIILNAQQNCVNLQFGSPIALGSKFRVSINVSACVNPFNIGGTNFRFNYNTNTLANPVIVAGTNIFPSTSFEPTTTVGSSAATGTLSINTAKISGTLGLPIPTTGVDVMIIEFDIINPLGNTGLVWRTSTFPNPKTAIVDADAKVVIINAAPSLDIPIPLPAVSVKGKLFADRDKDCLNSSGDIPLSNYLIRASSSALGNYYTISQANGDYELFIPNTNDIYNISLASLNNLWELCPTSKTIQNPQAGQLYDIAVQPTINCHFNTIFVGNAFLRRCFSNVYRVYYKNEGTINSPNTYIVVTLDPNLTFESATAPNTALGNNQYRFDIGDLDFNQNGFFEIKALLNCNGTVTGQTHFVKGEVFPKSNCSNTSSSSKISSNCNTTKTSFSIENVSNAPLTDLSYIIIEDDMLFKQAVLPTLTPAEIFGIETPANGSTWRVEVKQNGKMISNSVVEGCGTNSSGQFSLGFVNQFKNGDDDPSVSICYRESRTSYDPNDKSALPKGVTNKHYIEQNTPIEYLIRFQNTGTDTAINVRIEDVIDIKNLDLGTLRILENSHPMKLKFEGRDKLIFDFPNIMLPDSNVSEINSHGFVRFVVQQQKDVILGTSIKNKASIFFDFNDAIVTNEYFHTVGREFLLVKSQEVLLPNVKVLIKPNPIISTSAIEIEGKFDTNLRLEIFDALGRKILTQYSDNQYFELNKNELPNGVFSYRIYADKQLVANGKIIAQ